jgi:hypothetical protein
MPFGSSIIDVPFASIKQGEQEQSRRRRRKLLKNLWPTGMKPAAELNDGGPNVSDSMPPPRQRGHQRMSDRTFRNTNIVEIGLQNYVV